MIGPLTPGLGSGSLITSPVIPWLMVELIDLSGYVEEGQPVYPGNQRTQFFPTSTHEETGITWKRRNDEETGAISRKFAARRAGSTDEHPNVRSILVSEHGPTHVDSLSHLDPTNEGTIDRIPLDRFYGDAVGLDVSHLSPDEYITVETLETALAEADLELRSGDAITLHTGHRQRTYSVDDPEKRYEYLYEFTGLDGEAAEWLVEQGVENIGIDAISIDNSDALDTMAYPAYDVCAEHDILNMENMANIDRVAGKRFTLCAFPLKLNGGTGSPIRPVAILE